MRIQIQVPCRYQLYQKGSRSFSAELSLEASKCTCQKMKNLEQNTLRLYPLRVSFPSDPCTSPRPGGEQSQKLFQGHPCKIKKYGFNIRYSTKYAYFTNRKAKEMDEWTITTRLFRERAHRKDFPRTSAFSTFSSSNACVTQAQIAIVDINRR